MQFVVQRFPLFRGYCTCIACNLSGPTKAVSNREDSASRGVRYKSFYCRSNIIHNGTLVVCMCVKYMDGLFYTYSLFGLVSHNTNATLVYLNRMHRK